MSDFIPVDEEQMRELYDNAPTGSHARDVWNELQRTEKERARLHDLLDAAIAGRNALRADLQTELMAVRKELAELQAEKLIDEDIAEATGYSNGYVDGKKGEKAVEWAPGHGPQPPQPVGGTAETELTGLSEMRMAARAAKDSGFKVVQLDVDVALSLLAQLAENAAWMRVAVESNGEVDKYLRSVDPTLPEHYGMPADGVYKVVEALKRTIQSQAALLDGAHV